MGTSQQATQYHTSQQGWLLRVCLVSLLATACSSAVARPQPSVELSVAETAAEAMARITIDATQQKAISPLIYGISGGDPEALKAIRPTLRSWGGNPNSRYNWKLGNAWNAARDWQYRNGDYGYQGQSASDDFVAATNAAGAEVRLALPTLGWVAKDNNTTSCSFPLPDGGCGDANQATCSNPGQIADPTLTSVPSDVESITAWVQHLRSQPELRVRFFALDNEPELWGHTHYDVHPTCTTYAEIRDRYLEYATAVRTVAPEAELLGPVTCCWYFYSNSAAGEADRNLHGDQPFLPWFLNEVRAHDQQKGMRTLDVLDIHYYPEGVYNSNDDPQTAAQRVRSTRSLWDPSYRDESWINESIMLIPRMKEIIAKHYPGLKLGISEWNWGGEQSMSGALAIADVLGIFGREDVYLASYWTSPPAGSPAMYAFQLYTNYDGQGGRFGNASLQTVSSQPDTLSAYASFDSTTTQLKLILINKDPNRALTTDLQLTGFLPNGNVMRYRYDTTTDGIVGTKQAFGNGRVMLPAYSMTLLVVEGVLL